MSSTLVSTDVVPVGSSWLSVVPPLLSDLGYSLHSESPESLADVYAHDGLFTSGHNSDVPPSVETLIRDNMIDNLYDDRLHAITLIDHCSGAHLGIVYYRDLTEQEVSGWIKSQYVSAVRAALRHDEHDDNALIDSNMIHESGDGDVDMDRRLSERVSLNVISRSTSLSHDNVMSDHLSTNNTSVFSGWIKIELIVIRPQYSHRHLGTVLLLSALYTAAKRHHNHAVLHVAGGDHNVPALHLYKSIGFVPLPSEWFSSPNRNLLACLNIHRALRHVDWKRLLTKLKALTHENNGYEEQDEQQVANRMNNHPRLITNGKDR